MSLMAMPRASGSREFCRSELPLENLIQALYSRPGSLTQNIAQIFRIELGREGGRAHQIAKHNRQMPALELAGNVGLRCGSRGRGRWYRLLSVQNGVAEFLAMAEGKAKRCQVVVGQLRKRIAINIILGKCVGVAAKAEALEPVPQVAHRANGCSVPSTSEFMYYNNV
jgi:hypothetical protein